MIRAVIFDLDGVICHHDPAVIAEIERLHGLGVGAIAEVAFGRPLLASVITGQITRAQWVQEIGDQLGHPDAAREWGAVPSQVDQAVVGLAEEIRASGVATAILTNGTDQTRREVGTLGLDRWFDPICNSAEIGVAKPDPRAFAVVLDRLKVPGHETFYTDDSRYKLSGAEELGMFTHHFTDVAGLRTALSEAGLTNLLQAPPLGATDSSR